MARKKTEPNRINDMLDDLLAYCQGPKDVLREFGLINSSASAWSSGR